MERGNKRKRGKGERKEGTYAREGDPSKRHLCSLKVEEVHQLDRLALAESAVVDPLGLVVQLELDREDLDVFWAWQGRKERNKSAKMSHGSKRESE